MKAVAAITRANWANIWPVRQGTAEAGREGALQLLHLLLDQGGDGERIRLGRLVDGQAGGGLAVDIEVRGVGLRAELDPRHVLQPQDAATIAARGLDDDVGELLRRV